VIKFCDLFAFSGISATTVGGSHECASKSSGEGGTDLLD